MAAAKIPPAGTVFNEWTVLARGNNDKRGGVRVWARCSCGSTYLVATGNLRSGGSRSCGHSAMLVAEGIVGLRGGCGTSRGYRKHRINGEDPCDLCSKANIEYYRVYNNAHREKRKEDGRRYYKRHSSERLSKDKEYRSRKAKIILSRNRRYRNNNRESVRAANSRRKQLIRGNLDALDRQLAVAYREVIAERLCFYCRGTEEVMHDDHFFPLAKGGKDYWWNLVRACYKCNLSKRDRCGTWFILRHYKDDHVTADQIIAAHQERALS